MPKSPRLLISTECGSCTSKCCAQPLDSVYLTQAEIDVISASSGLAATEFVTHHLNPHTGHRFKILELPCRFLDSNTGKCGVYEARPLGCRVYPFTIDALTGRIGFVPSLCGEQLKIWPHQETSAWGITELETDIRAWLGQLWREAT